MNILLVNPWITDFAAYDFWVKPLGLLYAGAFLKQRGHTVRIVDCMDRFGNATNGSVINGDNKYNTGKFRREIIEKPACLSHVSRHFCRYGISIDTFIALANTGVRPDTILVSSVMTYWYPGVVEAVSQLKDLFPGVPVILGGIYATLCEDHARELSGADVVAAGSSPSEIIHTVESAGPSEAGTDHPGAVTNDHFNDWPEPVWEVYGTLKTAMVLTTRGCPMNCTVCSSKILFDGFERRDPAKSAREIIALSQRGVGDIAFCDDALLIGTEKHAAILFETLIAEHSTVRLHTPNGLHIREITPKIAGLMKRAGVATVRLSLETASVERADDFSNKVTRDEFTSAVEVLYAAGYEPDDLGSYIMVGLPGQTYGEVIDTINFVADNGVNIRPALFSPVPGTVEFDRAVQFGMIRYDDDPVLHNNTIRTVDWFEGGKESYDEFSKRVSDANARTRKK
ncbi:B12-binding domain-containing radical SAM protein [Candidatus Latescibacterota bacterium]